MTPRGLATSPWRTRWTIVVSAGGLCGSMADLAYRAARALRPQAARGTAGRPFGRTTACRPAVFIFRPYPGRNWLETLLADGSCFDRGGSHERARPQQRLGDNQAPPA